MYKLFIIILFNISICGMDNLNIKLSEKEKEWIAVNKNIKLDHLSNVIKTDYYIGGKENLQPLINIIEKSFNDEDFNPEFFQEESLEYMKDNFKFSDKINEYLNKI